MQKIGVVQGPANMRMSPAKEETDLCPRSRVIEIAACCRFLGPKGLDKTIYVRFLSILVNTMAS